MCIYLCSGEWMHCRSALILVFITVNGLFLSTSKSPIQVRKSYSFFLSRILSYYTYDIHYLTVFVDAFFIVLNGILTLVTVRNITWARAWHITQVNLNLATTMNAWNSSVQIFLDFLYTSDNWNMSIPVFGIGIKQIFHKVLLFIQVRSTVCLCDLVFACGWHAFEHLHKMLVLMQFPF